MRPKKHETTDASDLFRARLDQIINLKHELVQLAGKVDWDWIDGEIAPLYSDNGRPGTLGRATQIRSQQQRQRGWKLYSFHAPEVECIGKGTLPGNPYDGHRAHRPRDRARLYR